MTANIWSNSVIRDCGILKGKEAVLMSASRTQGYILWTWLVYIKHLTRSCRVSYVPRRAKVVNVLTERQVLVKQGTETTRFRTGSTLHPCQYVHMQASWLKINCLFHFQIMITNITGINLVWTSFFQVLKETVDVIESRYAVEKRGIVFVKGKGEIETFFVTNPKL